MFSEKETEYLKSQQLARVATVSSDGQPDVVPVAYEFDGKYLWVGSGTQEIFLRTRKYKNVNAGHTKVALVIDDLESVDPWRPRQIKVYGTADVVDHPGRFGQGKYLRITPAVSWSFGISAPVQGYSQAQGRNSDWRTKTVHSEST